MIERQVEPKSSEETKNSSRIWKKIVKKKWKNYPKGFISFNKVYKNLRKKIKKLN